MSVLLIATAGMLTAPEFDGMPLTFRDYPSRYIAEDKSAAAAVILQTDKTGEIRDCQVVSYLGDRLLAQRMCRIISKKKMVPASDVDGDPIEGMHLTMLKFSLPDTKVGKEVEQAVLKPDLNITVAQLVGSNEKNLQISVSALVDKSGEVVGCNGKREPERIAYEDAACWGVNELTFPTYIGPDANSIPYVRNVTVNFSEQAG